MRVVVLESSSELPVALSLAKQHLEVDSNDRDELVEQALAAAIDELEGPQGWLGRSLHRQTLRATLDGFPTERLMLPLPPVISISAVRYTGLDGADHVVDPLSYKVDSWGRLALLPARFWPIGGRSLDGVSVDYVAGYGAADLPPAIARAILLATAAHYENRLAEVMDARAVVAGNPAFERLLSNYRIWS